MQFLEIVSVLSFQIIFIFMIVKMTRYAFCNMIGSHVIDYSSTLKFAIILISTNLGCVEYVMSDEQ